MNAEVVNTLESVAVAGNKLRTFQTWQGNPNLGIPEFTADRDVAQSWLPTGVVVRHHLNGHSGSGIEIIREGEVPTAPLYTKLLKRKAEYRVHVVNARVIDVQQKRKRSDYSGEVNTDVRNWHTGWVYCRENLTEPESLRSMAIEAVSSLGLDFGAVDILYNEHYNQCTVLEVNTAPGLEGTTLERYRQAFTEYFS